LLIHQLLGAGDDRVAARIAGAGEPRDELRHGERALEIAHPTDDIRGGGLFGGRLLSGSGKGNGRDESGQHCDGKNTTHWESLGIRCRTSVLEGAKLPGRTGNASVAGGWLLPSASGPSYLDPVSLKIVFNGAEYDSVEAMPPDVRAQYNEVLESLKKTGGDEVLSALQRVSSGTGGLSENIMTTHREIVVNGRKYGSVGEMLPDVRGLYEKAFGQSGAAGAGSRRKRIS